MDLLAFYENNYYKTLEARDRLLTRIQLTAAILFTEFTIISYMCRTVDIKNISPAVIFFIATITFTLAALLYSSFLLYKAYSDSSYQPIPYANAINAHFNDLIKHYKTENYNDEESRKMALDDLEFFLINEYSDSSAVNDLKMEVRSKNSHSSIKMAFLSLIGIAFSSTIFIGNDMDASSPRKPLDVVVKEMPTSTPKNIDQHGDINICLEMAKTIIRQRTMTQENPLNNQSLYLQVVDNQLMKTTNHQEDNKGLNMSENKNSDAHKKSPQHKKPVGSYQEKPKPPTRREICYDHKEIKDVKK